MRKVAVLRPDSGANSTLGLLKRAGVEAIRLPLFELKKLDWEAPNPEGFDGILVTSANAIRYAGDELEKLKSLPVYAVGPTTAQAANAEGFRIAQIGNAGINRFLKQIPHDLKLVHLVAEDRLDYRLVWQKVEPIVMYKSEQVEDVDGSVLDGNVVLVHSARAGKRLAEIAQDKASIRVVAISKQAADACGAGWEKIVFPREPSDPRMVALAANLCDKPAKE